jgi:hypothetical protein
VLAASSPLCRAAVDWVQVRATIHYQRTGTVVATADGSFTYRLDAEIDQVMARVKSKKPGKYPSLILPDGYRRSFRSSGTSSLQAEVTQTDAATGRTYSASAGLNGVIGSESDLQIEEVKSAAPLGEGYTAKLAVAARLSGRVASNYVLPVGQPEAAGVLLWPSPVRFEPPAGFISQGTLTPRPALGTRPADRLSGLSYDLFASAEEAPGYGGLHPPSLGAVTTGTGDSWTMAFFKTKTFRPLESGDGHYTDTISIEVRLVPRTLDIPQPE